MKINDNPSFKNICFGPITPTFRRHVKDKIALLPNNTNAKKTNS